MPGHVPVLLNEAMAMLLRKEDGFYIDATFGAGGYTKKILQSIPNSFVLGIDQDQNLVSFVREIQQLAPARFKFVNENNANLKNIVASYEIKQIDGIIFDLGVSSMQLEASDRGFSFNLDGPLDMRMSDRGISALEVVNTYTEAQLADIIYHYGEERKAKKIAKAIVNERINRQIASTKQFADIVKSVINSYKGINPATKTFQALRIFVNNELENLEVALRSAIELLSVKGSLIVVAFHSLEDRIVKHLFKYFALQRSGEKQFRLINKKPITPEAEELAFNHRARSAKLRGLVREF
ncbi:MAG: 16S rRNA (cytosine(1402)-N(4))-methyltransferase RsmH [Holosporales bacterium]|jgi:16S rRNA (cytosine1402-N4)-methyltransferase|nr:16S rRNA (cytosine(1402)-N(4))-methyltransferase RsmH [Holosporales bacterium]